MRAMAKRTVASTRVAAMGLALAGALTVFGAGPARAIIGGAEDNGALKASAVMVLGSAGNVCTGIVVAPTAILTAGHCARNAAEHRVHYMDDSGSPILLPIAAVAVHPGYTSKAVSARTRSVDLALIRLGAPLPGRFRPAVLSAAPQPRAGAIVTLAGYGGTGKGRADGKFRSIDLPVVEPYGPGRILLWLRGQSGRPAGACVGDSGGPMIEGGAIVAVTGWAEGGSGTSCGKTTQGVLVAPQRDWIDSTLTGWNTRARWQ